MSSHKLKTKEIPRETILTERFLTMKRFTCIRIGIPPIGGHDGTSDDPRLAVATCDLYRVPMFLESTNALGSTEISFSDEIKIPFAHIKYRISRRHSSRGVEDGSIL
jgi:hypothetical protein